MGSGWFWGKVNGMNWPNPSFIPRIRTAILRRTNVRNGKQLSLATVKEPCRGEQTGG